MTAYRERRISHHQTWTAAAAKLTRLRKANPDIEYFYRLNEDAAHMPHVILKIERVDDAPYHVGDKLHHARRGAVVFEGLDCADPSGATAWVRFADGESGMVSTHLLSRTPDGTEPA